MPPPPFLLLLLLLAASSCLARSIGRLHDGAPKHCAESEHPSGGGRIALSCRMRTVAGAPALLAALPPSRLDKVADLAIECSDALFFESSLDIAKRSDDGVSNNFLARLGRLRDLRIEYCKIRYVPASVLSPLVDLRTLTLKTHNDDWSAMSMEFHRDSFAGLSELRDLDLGENNVWTLPAEVFCPLANLRTLNLTMNRLRDISQMGFSDWGDGPTAPGRSCNTALEVLDASDNDIVALPDNGLTSLRSLQSLLLQDNAISLVTDRSFVGLVSLQILNLSSNALEALPPDMFKSCREIKQIYLDNNTISVLAPTLFEGLDQLQILDLSDNELDSEWVNRDTFTGLVRLIVLNLSHNKITKIDSLMFSDLNNLQFLSLEDNKITKISDGAFSNLKNLHSLSLAQNKLTHVDAHHFSNLYVLSQLFLDGNRIVNVHRRAFENVTRLLDLSLNGNALEEVPEAVKSLRYLRSLGLESNEITSVNGVNFEGLEDLKSLRLSGNSIGNVSKDAFVTLSSVETLYLSSNKIKHIERGAFASNPTIQGINLDGNELSDIRGVFVNTTNLKWLNVSDNRLTFFDYGHLPPSLEWLDMHKNRIQRLENEFATNEVNIKMLDVSSNMLSVIEQSSLPNNIQVVLLNDNHIERVTTGAFLNKPYLQKVVLSGNELKKVDAGAFALNRVPEDLELPEFYIGGNPFHCDCTMEWLQKINHMGHSRQHPRVMDLEIITCTLAHTRGKTSDYLVDLKPTQFLCPYESHCFALCHCCDFNACDCKMTCPDACSCYHDLTWSSNVVDCSSAGFERVPDKIPMDATELYLDGNNLNELGNHVFIGKKKLQTLFLNNSNVNSINNKTFNGIESLKVLHLENNNLRKLDGMEFKKLTNLNVLHLESNRIRTINKDTFSSLGSLELLKLDDNGIVDYLPWRIELDDDAVKTKVSLRGNKWRCDCEGIADDLERWLSEHYEDAGALMCHEADGSPTDMTVADAVRKCKKDPGVREEDAPNESITVRSVTQKHLFLDTSKLADNYIPYVVVVSAMTVVILLLCVLLFLFRDEFRLWVHSRYGVRVFTCSPKSLNDHRHRSFDAYVVYNARDDDFVSRTFAELEANGHSLCLHHRDLQAGSERRCDDLVVDAVENSKRLLIVLSMRFIQNEWYRPEFRAALQSGIDSINASHRRQKIIFVVTTDLSAVALDPDLKALLKTCSVIVWGERKCREKLNFRLPDPRVKQQQQQQQQKRPSSQPANNIIKHVNSGDSPPVVGKLVNATRYTASPTCHDTWFKYQTGNRRNMSPPGGGGTPSPTQSTCVSGAASEDDEGCWDGSGSGRLDHNYASIDSREHRPLRKEQYLPPPPPPIAAHHVRNTYFV